jgi:hypothetical protein
MKNVGILACAVLFLSVPAFAQTPAKLAPLTREALTAALGLGQPAVSSACGTQPGKVRFAAAKGPGGQAACNAMATCQSGSVSCSGNSSCTAVDSDCSSGFAGYVTCDGQTTQCAACVCAPRDFCCRCGQTDDCVTCCRCGGGTLVQCSLACS